MLGLADPATACSPPVDSPPLTEARAREVAVWLIGQATVIADGVITWSPRGWKARSAGVGIDRLPLPESLPTFRPSRILKGRMSPAFTIVDADGCGDGTEVAYLPPGTPVRLLLEPGGVAAGTPIWTVIDASSSGSRDDERRVAASIDALLGTPRDPRAASLVSEPPPPPQ